MTVLTDSHSYKPEELPTIPVNALPASYTPCYIGIMGKNASYYSIIGYLVI